jgi:hypothetical protein
MTMESAAIAHPRGVAGVLSLPRAMAFSTLERTVIVGNTEYPPLAAKRF